MSNAHLRVTDIPDGTWSLDLDDKNKIGLERLLSRFLWAAIREAAAIRVRVREDYLSV